MAITGLPDPAIHRKCKRCGGWFHAHEGARCWPPKVGLLSWVHVTTAESMDLEREMKFYCGACQELNAQAQIKARKVTVQVIMAALVAGVVVLLAWAFDLSSWVDGALRGR